jgi:putative ABC transport system permease protein
MLEPRWRKVLRDAWLHKARTAMVALAIAVGLAGAGTIAVTWALVREATGAGYRASLPASATLRIEPVDEALLAQVRALPEVAAVRARRTASLAMRVAGTWRTALVYALDDYEATHIGRLRPEAGQWPPADGAVVIERSSVDFAGAAIGEPVAASLDRADPATLAVTGIVRDVSLAPGWMEHVVYGFATPATLAQLGTPAGFGELQFRVRDADADRSAVRRVAAQVQALAERDGRRVLAVDVPEPGQHIHAAQMDSLLMTQAAFAALTLLVCAFLVVNLVAAMLAGQVREIGTMKALGARPAQLARMYLAFAAALGGAATLAALPVALLVGHRYAGLKAELLNFPLDGVAIPAWAIVALIATGVVLPVAAALVPVRRGCRLPVAQALRDVGMGSGSDGSQAPRALRVNGLARPLLLALGNALRRRQRTLLTLAALALGGAVFLGAGNLRAGVIDSVDLLFSSMRFDIVLRLVEPADRDRLEAIAGGVAGVARAEAWAGTRASVMHDEGTPGSTFALTALAPDTALVAPRMLGGRWLEPGDAAAVVAGRGLLRDEPGLVTGATVRLSIDGKPLALNVVGIADGGPGASAYVTRETLAAHRGDARATSVVVASSLRNPASQLDLIARLRVELDRAGMPVATSQLLGESRASIEDHLLMVVQFLAVMGWVIIAVGGMGLASTMGLAVLERRREIGVLRAIGARHRSVFALIQVEGLAIALASWLLALPLSAPMSLLLASSFGRVMFTVPLRALPPPDSAARWLALVVVVSLLACAAPAIRAMRIPVATALKYE